MRLIKAIVFGMILISFENSVAQSPRQLLGKLVKGDDQSQYPLTNAKVVLEESGSQDISNDNGHFHLFLPDIYSPGDEITISVVALGYAIYEPPGGKLRIPKDLARTRIVVQLLPKGSLKFLSDAQLRSLVERTAKDSNRRTSGTNISASADPTPYLEEWAIQHGFTLAEIRAQLARWAENTASQKANAYD